MRSVICLGLLVAAFAGLSRLPLSWFSSAAGGMPMTPDTEFVGTVWDGTVTNIPGIGNLELQMRPLKGLGGGEIVTFQVNSPGLSASGGVTLSQALSVRGQGQISALSHLDGRLTGLAGEYRFSLAGLEFSDDCEMKVPGRIETDILMRNAQRLQWKGPELNGDVNCDGGDILAKLSGQDNLQTINAQIRISPAGTFQSLIEVQTRDPRAGSVLGLYGFQPAENGFRLNEQGRWN